MNEAMTDNRKRRRPIPGEGFAWVGWHRIRGHRVEAHGYSLSHGGSRRSWMCLTCWTGTGYPGKGLKGQWPA
jgi:hypothetical protein